MELFAKIVNGFNNYFRKKKSILDVCLGSEYTFVSINGEIHEEPNIWLYRKCHENHEETKKLSKLTLSDWRHRFWMKEWFLL